MLPVVTSACGIAFLYGAWSRRIRSDTLANGVGWALLTISLFLWMPLAGPDFGPVYAFLVIPLVAWVVVLANGHMPRNRHQVQPPLPLSSSPARAVLRHSVLFFVAVPLAAVVSALLGLLSASWLPWSDVDRMAYGVLVMPIFWGLLALWVCADTRLARPAITLLVAGCLSGIALMI